MGKYLEQYKSFNNKNTWNTQTMNSIVNKMTSSKEQLSSYVEKDQLATCIDSALMEEIKQMKELINTLKSYSNKILPYALELDRRIEQEQLEIKKKLELELELKGKA